MTDKYNLITSKEELKIIKKKVKNCELLSPRQASIFRQMQKNFKEKDLQKACNLIFKRETTLSHRNAQFVMIGNENNQKKVSSGLISGFPDAMMMIEGHVFFVEFKRVGTGVFSENQVNQHYKISQMGFEVYLIDLIEVFEEVLDKILKKI